jgi:hypothetical protein
MRYSDAFLLIFVLILLWSFYKAQKDPATAFNLFDLMMDHGKVSKLALAFLTTLGLTSWIMVRLTTDGKLTEGYFMAYGGMWVAPIVAKMFSAPPVSGTTTTSATQTSTTEVAP